MQQERVWFFEQLSPGNLAYNFQATVSLHGEVNARRCAPRSTRSCAGTRSADRVHHGRWGRDAAAGTKAKAALRVLDIPAEHADNVIASELRKPFDLTKPPLARWLLLRHGGGENTFVHIEHHFVHDGWSLAVLLSELSALYPAFAAGQPSPLPDLEVQYADYALLAAGLDAGRRTARSRGPLDHRAGRSTGRPGVAGRPPRPSAMSFRGAAPRVKVPAELSRALRSFSRQHRVSLFSTMYAGFAALLYRYTGQQDLLVGTGAANRSQPEIEPLLGMIVNSVVLRTRCRRRVVVHGLARPGTAAVVNTLAWSDTPVDAVSTRSAQSATPHAPRCSRSCSASTTPPCPTWTSAASPAPSPSARTARPSPTSAWSWCPGPRSGWAGSPGLRTTTLT